jgi:hypothetical protein
MTRGERVGLATAILRLVAIALCGCIFLMWTPPIWLFWKWTNAGTQVPAIVPSIVELGAMVWMMTGVGGLTWLLAPRVTAGADAGWPGLAARVAVALAGVCVLTVAARDIAVITVRGAIDWGNGPYVAWGGTGRSASQLPVVIAAAVLGIALIAASGPLGRGLQRLAGGADLCARHDKDAGADVGGAR